MYDHLDKKERQMDEAKGYHQWCDDLPSEFSPQNEREADLVKAGVPIKEIEALRQIRG